MGAFTRALRRSLRTGERIIMPEKISKEDALQLENFALRLESLEAQKVAAESQREAFAKALRDRYQLGDQDRLDLRTLAIVRAPKAELPAEPVTPPA